MFEARSWLTADIRLRLRGAMRVPAVPLSPAACGKGQGAPKGAVQYGGTSVAGRAGTFRRAVKRRLCDAGPRFQSFRFALE